MQKVVACFHGGCSDGIASSWVLSKVWPNAEFYGIRPGETELGHINFEGALVFFLDVCPAKFPENTKHIFVYDHHLTNKKFVDKNGISMVFDTERCGCLITWDQFFPGQKRPWFLEYIDDRDRWQWKLPDSREINEAIYSQGWMERLDELEVQTPEDLASVGRGLLLEKEKKIQEAISLAVPARLCEYPIWLCSEESCWKIRSEVGNRLCSVPFSNGKLPAFSAICHKDTETQDYWVSLRGTEFSPCLATISEKFGGGGHSRASGFTIQNSEFSEIILRNYFFRKLFICTPKMGLEGLVFKNVQDGRKPVYVVVKEVKENTAKIAPLSFTVKRYGKKTWAFSPDWDAIQKTLDAETKFLWVNIKDKVLESDGNILLPCCEEDEVDIVKE
ncbi:putative DHH superfamily phosphohydrolase [Port-miou virus]|uniref:Putative DHH superfamily phosphohydrolase n=1 Tax=Port-miou virus TaxID=1733873 RepID=A0A0N9PU54_9VIRU|nr:putative DHH superfamily phosphohydrolase [Port-miou virus]